MNNFRLAKLNEFINEYYIRHDKFPSFQYLLEKTNWTKQMLLKYLRELENQGKINRNYSQYTLPESVKISEIEKKNIVNIILRIVMILIGFGAGIISFWFTMVWFQEFLNLFLSALLSLIMILFSITSFEIIIYLWKNKSFILVFTFSILWIVVVSFSMFSTVAGQYNKRMTKIIKLEEKKYKNLSKITMLKNIIDSEKEIKIELKQKREKLKSHQNLLIQFYDLEYRRKNWRLYWNILNQVNAIEKEIRKLLYQLKDIRKDKIIEAKKTKGRIDHKIIKVDFYSWIGKLFKIKSDQIQFWISIFPAVFVDLVCPIAFAVGLFLVNDKENKNGK